MALTNSKCVKLIGGMMNVLTMADISLWIIVSWSSGASAVKENSVLILTSHYK
jgi:hypothetical protein